MGSPKKDQSFASTFYNTHSNSANNGLTAHKRPQTANLTYAGKPMKKQLISWNQSSSTWRHSAKRYSFSREKRFRTVQPYSMDILEPQIPCTKSKKSCSFGKGKKKPISQVVLRNAKQKPAPNAYDYSNLDEVTRSPNKGKTFGNTWKKYEKIYIDHRKDTYSPHFTKENPGPIYSTRQTPGKDKNAKTIYPRQRMFTQKMSDMMRYVPGPRYNPKERQLYNMVGMNERNFSFGDRMDLSSPANDYPGPHYKIDGFCNKFTKTKKKNLPIQINQTIW